MDTQNKWWHNVRRNKSYRRKFFRTLSIIFCAASLVSEVSFVETFNFIICIVLVVLLKTSILI